MAIHDRQGCEAAGGWLSLRHIPLHSCAILKAIVPFSYVGLESPIPGRVALLISLPNSLRLDLDFGFSFRAVECGDR